MTHQTVPGGEGAGADPPPFGPPTPGPDTPLGRCWPLTGMVLVAAGMTGAYWLTLVELSTGLYVLAVTTIVAATSAGADLCARR